MRRGKSAPRNRPAPAAPSRCARVSVPRRRLAAGLGVSQTGAWSLVEPFQSPGRAPGGRRRSLSTSGRTVGWPPSDQGGRSAVRGASRWVAGDAEPDSCRVPWLIDYNRELRGKRIGDPVRFLLVTPLVLVAGLGVASMITAGVDRERGWGAWPWAYPLWFWMLFCAMLCIQAPDTPLAMACWRGDASDAAGATGRSSGGRGNGRGFTHTVGAVPIGPA